MEAGLPANNSGAMYICVPVCDDEPGDIIVCVNPARVIPDKYSSESTWPIPKSVSLAWINFGFSILRSTAADGFNVGAATEGGRISDFGFLNIHLWIGGVYERKLARQSFAVEIARDFSGFVRLRQGQPRELQTGGRRHGADTGADSLPALEDLIAELRLAPRTRHLPLDEAVISFDCIADLGQQAHG